jgi:hypothetical protein
MPSIPGIEGMPVMAGILAIPLPVPVTADATEAVGIAMVIVPMESMMIMSCSEMLRGAGT